MILLVGSHIPASEARLSEYALCLSRNLDNPLVEAIHVFVEDPVDGYHARLGKPPNAAVEGLAALLKSPKVRRVDHGRRTTYAEFFAHANANLAGRNVLVSNADVWFDDTLALLDRRDLSGVLVCLSKRDGGRVLHNADVSQDSWAFLAPIRDFPCAWPLGVPGCDNRLAAEAARAGLRVANPCRSVAAHHVDVPMKAHDEARRLWGEYLPVEPRDISALEK